MRPYVLALLVLAGCAQTPTARVVTDVVPAVDDWGPHHGAPLEWWYVSSACPETGLAFHVAFFRAQMPAERGVLGIPLRTLLPGAYGIANLSVTDLRTGERYVRQRSDIPFASGRLEGDPLRLELGPWRLAKCGPAGRYVLRVGPLDLTLQAEKPRTVHPPGCSGNAALGRMAYQSITRLRYEGTWRDRPVSGTAWMDHQWGWQVPMRDARWDWHGLQLDDGTDLMLYDLTDPEGTQRCTQATATDAAGVSRALSGVRLAPLATWRSPRGHLYVVGWTAEIDGEMLTIRPLTLDEEISGLLGVPYWEGPVVVEGRFRGREVRGVGMGEHLPWPACVPSAPAVTETSPSR